MYDTYLSEVATERPGWAPIATLFILAVSIMIVVRFATWIWMSGRTNPPDISTFEKRVISASPPYWPAQRAKPVLVGTPFAPPVVEVEHVGAEGWRAHELKPLVPLDDATKAALMTETAEFRVVWDEEAGELVSDEAASDEPAPGTDIECASPQLALIEDELGAWDPNAVDWLEPATYVETLSWTVRTYPDLLGDDDRRRLAYVIRREALTLADAVITGGS